MANTAAEAAVEGVTHVTWLYRRLRRTLALVTVVAVISLVAMLPARAFHTFVIPSGEGCGFDVLVESEHIDSARIGNGDITLTNLETGATYLQRSRYTSTETFDPSTNTIQGTISGRYWFGFFPGDQGPFGEVQEPGAMFFFSGTIEYTINETGIVSAFTYEGQVKDVCSLLSD